MPNKYKTGTKSILVRMPGELRDRLDVVAEAATARYGDISATAIARRAIEDRVEELEKELGITSPVEK